MKVKIFRCEDMEKFLENLIEEVNEFIKDKKIIDIKYQEHTSYEAYNEPNNIKINEGLILGDVFGSILVLYKDNEDEE